jgi:hypothetical protein
MIKNITLSVEETLIRRARERAAAEQKSLNGVFREWIARYVGGASHFQDYRHLMKRLRHIRAGRTFSREEMNER